MKKQCQKHYVFYEDNAGCLDCKALVAELAANKHSKHIVGSNHDVADNPWYLIDILSAAGTFSVCLQSFGTVAYVPNFKWLPQQQSTNIVGLRMLGNNTCKEQVSLLLRANNTYRGYRVVANNVSGHHFTTQLGINIFVMPSALGLTAVQLARGCMYHIELTATGLKIELAHNQSGTITLSSGGFGSTSGAGGPVTFHGGFQSKTHP